MDGDQQKYVQSGSDDGSQRDISEIAVSISRIIEKTAFEVFSAYRIELLSEHLTYIVPAVWGADEKGQLTDIQKKMNERIDPAVNKVIAQLDLQTLDAQKSYAMIFLIRGMFIMKITFMIEHFRNKLNKLDIEEQSLKDKLLNMKVQGSA